MNKKEEEGTVVERTLRYFGKGERDDMARSQGTDENIWQGRNLCIFRHTKGRPKHDMEQLTKGSKQACTAIRSTQQETQRG